MKYKQIANVLFVVGLIWFLFHVFFPPSFLWQWLPLPLFLFNPLTGGVIFLAGLLLRLFSPVAAQPVPQTGQQVSATPVSEVGQEEYSFWRNVLIVGLALWPFVFFFVTLGVGLQGAGSGDSPSNMVLLVYLTFFALPVSIVSLIVATNFRKNSNVQAATRTLRAPFYYLLVIVGILIYFYFLDNPY